MFLRKYKPGLEGFLKNDGKGLFTIEQLQKGNTYKIIGEYIEDAKWLRNKVMLPAYGEHVHKPEECVFGITRSQGSNMIPAKTNELVLVLSQPDLVQVSQYEYVYKLTVKTKLFLFGSGKVVQDETNSEHAVVLFKEVK